MAETTNIAWADSTFNPWIGCTKIAPGCDHCYAEADFGQRKKRAVWGPGNPRSRTSAANWKMPLQWNKNACWFIQCADCGWRGEGRDALCWNCDSAHTKPARRRVFCASLADVFDNEVDPSWRADLLQLIADTPNLDWLLLTKRIGNAHAMLNEASRRLSFRTALGWADNPLKSGPILDNVWIGATICNQAEADRDIPKLLALPARMRFLSMEPLLEHVDVFFDMTGELLHTSGDDYNPGWLDWIIAGGESGAHARPMHPDWVRSLRDQCAAGDAAFFFKQWGGRESGCLLDGYEHHAWPRVNS